MNRPHPTSPHLTPGELQSPRSELTRSPRSIGGSWERSVSTEREHSNQKMTGRGQNDRPRHWPTTPTHDRDISDHSPGSFPRGNPELYFAESETEVGAFLKGLVESQPAWRREAECRDMGTAVFFPIRGQSNKPGLAVCSSCPVKAECLAEALAEEVDHGIRGGLTARARVAARKAQAVTEAA